MSGINSHVGKIRSFQSRKPSFSTPLNCVSSSRLDADSLSTTSPSYLDEWLGVDIDGDGGTDIVRVPQGGGTPWVYINTNTNGVLATVVSSTTSIVSSNLEDIMAANNYIKQDVGTGAMTGVVLDARGTANFVDFDSDGDMVNSR